MGCVQIGNRAVIAEKITGQKYVGDPEYISEGKLQERGAVYDENKLTREEWEAWMQRHPDVRDAAASGCGKTTVIKALVRSQPRDLRYLSIEE